ncbi:hypothetical protein ACFE04_009635 [Oxalis oulophora]
METKLNEAKRQKSIAETKFKASNLESALKHITKAHQLAPNLDGLSSILAAFTILQSAASTPSKNPNWYKILQLEPFTDVSIIKKQYRKLALVLHPDKNPYVGCEEAFKLVAEGFRLLSDSRKRKEYDVKLRVEIQDEKISDLGNDEVEMFSTRCSKCRLMHKFERKYLGCDLMCSSCKTSFVAVEVQDGSEESDDDECLREFIGKIGLKKKRGNRDEGLEEVGVKAKGGGDEEGGGRVEAGNEVGGDSEWGGGRLRSRRLSEIKDRKIEEEPKQKRAKVDEDKMTLAEMQLKIRKRVVPQKEKRSMNEKTVGVEEKDIDKEKGKALKELETDKSKVEKTGVNMRMDTRRTTKRPAQKKRTDRKKNHVDSDSDYEESDYEDNELENIDMTDRQELETEKSSILKTGASMRSDTRRTKKAAEKKSTDRKKKHVDYDSDYENDDDIIDLTDSDFYDFNKARAEKCFKQGQVWAVYDKEDRMPRNYALINQVSVHPFRLKLSWLDYINNGDQDLISWEKMGFHVSCGRFKVNTQASISSINIFSHVVVCEREAKEIYRIYPKKGSVWAIYNETTMSNKEKNLDKRCYDIVVFLTTYSEVHGQSMAYLEKVDGYKTVFKRREIGAHAIRWLEKNDARLFSHWIPAKKLSGDNISDDLKDCWELDPASIPAALLTFDTTIYAAPIIKIFRKVCFRLATHASRSVIEHCFSTTPDLGCQYLRREVLNKVFLTTLGSKCASPGDPENKFEIMFVANDIADNHIYDRSMIYEADIHVCDCDWIINDNGLYAPDVITGQLSRVLDRSRAT